MSALTPPPAGDPFRVAGPRTHSQPGFSRASNRQLRPLPKWLPITVGAVVVLAGLGLVIWPFTTASSLLVVFFAVALFANGLGVLVRSRGNGLAIAGGILLIALGLFGLVFADFTVSVIMSFIGMTLLGIGVLWLAISSRFVSSRGASVLIPAIILVAAGLVTLIWPAFAIKVVAVVCGLLTIALGASLIWAATRMRSVSAAQQTIIIE